LGLRCCILKKNYSFFRSSYFRCYIAKSFKRLCKLNI